MHKFLPELRFELVQEVVLVDQLLVIMKHGLFDVKFDFIIQNLRQRF